MTRFTKCLLVLVVLLVAGGSFICFRFVNEPNSIAFSEPEFKFGWDEKHDRNAGWELVETQGDFDARFVLEVPKGERPSLVPEFKFRIIENRLFLPKESWIDVYLPLQWDGKSLDLERGTEKPTLSYNLAATLRTQFMLQRTSPNTVVLIFRMRYYARKNALDTFAERTVLVIVEVKPQE